MAGNTLRVDLEQARMDAQQLKQLAQECMDVYNQAKQLAGTTEDAWKGDSGAKMQNVLYDWMKKQSETANQLENTANAINQYVAIVEETDRKMAQAIAQNSSNVGVSSVAQNTSTTWSDSVAVNKPQSTTNTSNHSTGTTSSKQSSSKKKSNKDKDVMDVLKDLSEDVAEGATKLFKKFFD